MVLSVTLLFNAFGMKMLDKDLLLALLPYLCI